MTGPIVQSLAPSAGNDLTNKTYVDSQATPDATSALNGKVRLAGDLSGTAAAPEIGPNKVTNAKLANMSNPSMLKGSGSTDPQVADILLGSSLTMAGNTLSVNPSGLPFLPLAGGTMTGAGAIVQPLAPSADNDLTNKIYVDTFKQGSYVFRSTQELKVTPGEEYVFSTGNTTPGSVFTSPDVSCTMDTTGTVTIINKLPYTAYFKLTFISGSLLGEGGFETVAYQFESNSTTFGTLKYVTVLPTSIGGNFYNEITLVELIDVRPENSFEFTVKVVYNGTSRLVTVDGLANRDESCSCLIVDRVV